MLDDVIAHLRSRDLRRAGAALGRCLAHDPETSALDAFRSHASALDGLDVFVQGYRQALLDVAASWSAERRPEEAGQYAVHAVRERGLDVLVRLLARGPASDEEAHVAAGRPAPWSATGMDVLALGGFVERACGRWRLTLSGEALAAKLDCPGPVPGDRR